MNLDFLERDDIKDRQKAFMYAKTLSGKVGVDNYAFEDEYASGFFISPAFLGRLNRSRQMYNINVLEDKNGDIYGYLWTRDRRTHKFSRPKVDEPVELLREKPYVGVPRSLFPDVKTFVDRLFEKTEELKKLCASNDFKDKITISIIESVLREKVLTEDWHRNTIDETIYYSNHNCKKLGYEFLEVSLFSSNMEIVLRDNNNLNMNLLCFSIPEEDYGNIEEIVVPSFRRCARTYSLESLFKKSLFER